MCEPEGSPGSCATIDAPSLPAYQQWAYVKSSFVRTSDRFGSSIAMSADGSTLAVGAYLDDGPDDAQVLNGGAVFVFVNDGVTWTQQAYLIPAGRTASGQFGTVVALSADGNTLAVSEPLYDAPDGLGGLIANTGAVHLYTRVDTTWTPGVRLAPANLSANDRFGYTLALSGDGKTLAAGSLDDSSTVGINPAVNELATDAGAVHVFALDATWAQQAYIKASNTGANDRFGASVALSFDGDRLAVGAPLEQSNAIGVGGVQTNNTCIDCGAAYVFRRTTSWAQQSYVKASNTLDGQRFGTSVALTADGNQLAVGAIGEASRATGVDGDKENRDLPSAGAVYILDYEAQWRHTTYLKASNTDGEDRFGVSLAYANEPRMLLVGADFEDGGSPGVDGRDDNAVADAGAAYVFADDGGWSQRAYVKASNPGAGDRFGLAIAMAGDGLTFAASAFLEDSDATGIDGTQDDVDEDFDAGAVYVFR